MAEAALSPRVALAHWPMSSPALKLSVAKVASAAVIGIQRRIEGDHQYARLARLLDRRHDGRRVAGGDQYALGAGRDQALDGLDLGLVVAVIFAGEGHELDAGLFGLGLGTLAHLDEERIGIGLGDEADGGLLRHRAAGAEHDCTGHRAGEDEPPELLRHRFLPGFRSIGNGCFRRSVSGPNTACASP